MNLFTGHKFRIDVFFITKKDKIIRYKNKNGHAVHGIRVRTEKNRTKYQLLSGKDLKRERDVVANAMKMWGLSGERESERAAISLMAFKWKIQADLMSEAFDDLMWKLNLNHSMEKAVNRDQIWEAVLHKHTHRVQCTLALMFR